MCIDINGEADKNNLCLIIIINLCRLFIDLKTTAFLLPPLWLSLLDTFYHFFSFLIGLPNKPLLPTLIFINVD